MTTTSPSFTKEIAYDRFTKDYTATVDGQLIGSFSTHHEAEVAADEHVFNLLSDGLHIPAATLDGTCGDCGATLDSLGLCGCGAEEPTDVCPSCGDQLSWSGPGLCGACQEAAETWPEIAPTIHAADHTRTAPLSCSICGQPALHQEPHGAFCAGCWEAQGLWALWKTNSTEFVWVLRQQQARLNEMAERLATYLSRKNNAYLSMDSVLAMWRQLLGDDGPPEPRCYVVVARRQVAGSAGRCEKGHILASDGMCSYCMAESETHYEQLCEYYGERFARQM